MKKIRLGIDARIFSQAMNGVARYAIALLKSLSKNEKFEIYLFSDTPLREEYGPYISNCHLVLSGTRRFKKYWKNWTLPFQLSKHKIDIYHAVWDKGIPIISPCPAIMTIHDLYAISGTNASASEKKKLFKYINLFLEAFSAKKIFTVSESTKKEIIRKLYAKPDKVAVTYLDCDRVYLETMRPSDSAAELLPGVNPREYFVAIVGRLDDVRKNVYFLIRSFADFINKAAPQNKRYKLVIVGSLDKNSESFKSLKSLVKELGIEDKVVFTGYVEDSVLYALMSSAKAMVFISLFEGFGIPILEAFFFGVPLITSNVTSMPEIASGESALLVDPRSEGDLVAAMTSICDDSLLCNRLVENGRRRLQDFDWDSTMAKIVNIYDEILERR